MSHQAKPSTTAASPQGERSTLSTPMTDAAEYDTGLMVWGDRDDSQDMVVPAELARHLERDRALLVKALLWYADYAEGGCLANDALREVGEL